MSKCFSDSHVKDLGEPNSSTRGELSRKQPDCYGDKTRTCGSEERGILSCATALQYQNIWFRHLQGILKQEITSLSRYFSFLFIVLYLVIAFLYTDL